ncbi:hypothetical protein Tco_0578482 [Tanacetum coccineum]
MENTVYLVEHCARKDAPIRSPTGIGAGLGQHLAPMERSDKIPIGDWGGTTSQREAAEVAFEVAKEEDRTVMRLEEMKFLAICTNDLPEDDTYFIEEHKRPFEPNITCTGTAKVTPEVVVRA